VHYCDTTGEVNWVKSLITKYQAEDEKNNSFIVTFCGMDSVPSDIGTLMMVDYIKKNLDGRDCQSVELFFQIPKPTPGMAGGTLRSVIAFFDQPLSELQKTQDPYYLSPPNAPRPKTKSDIILVKYNQDLKLWYTTFVFAAINTRVVRRSSALNKYPASFNYQEYMTPKGFFKSLFIGVALIIGTILFTFTFVRNYVNARLPPPGEGPKNKEPFKNCFTAS